ncbi:hypothetical protein NJB1907f44_34070 [Mycobacterium marinum]|nr:hypothetical protein MMRN_46390 [Mycobacterium marinum]GJO07511.1 hypothetical protein NJB1907f34b_33980 [Mycobacterium marinum]GJO12863.1 hypothetical protein NJB1907E90_35700 [Mycobacterium marinum]GJO13746.1 hypothetical protein NJB1728e18_03010 [Mycobacterium marinum]GJO29008.1 hypothetical protein NJB1907E11_48120 [Mycobacterium marinum]
MAADSAWPAAALSQPTYGAAAAAIDTDAGPDQDPLDSPETTESNDDADAYRSCANPSQADAAANSGPEPAPENIRVEFISGGNQAKSNIITPQTVQPPQRPGQLACRQPPQLHLTP